MKIVIVTASINYQVYEKNLGASHFANAKGVMRMEGFDNVAKAYNISMRQFAGLTDDVIAIFVHDDVFLPLTFEGDLKVMLSKLPENWGVCGVAGAYTSLDVLKNKVLRKFYGNVNDRGTEWGKPLTEPMPVQTLDELMLIVNLKHGYHSLFDEQFPLDFYGADLCMQAHERGLGVYAIQAYVHHNSSRAFGGRTPGFFESEAKFKKKWAKRLPIATTCSLMK